MLPENTLAPNTIIQERYRIVRLMGRGGMGAVYKAIDTRLKTPVALKQTLVSGAQYAKAFRREAQLLASLRHPALPVVIDYFTVSSQQFLVMQFIPGPDLAALLAKQNRPFPLDDVLDWTDHLLHALTYLHRQQPPVIHRDIKPQNLKLSEDGTIVLLDFGLAKGAGAMQTQGISSRSIRGYTPNYAPLEQIRGNITDQRSDLFSLAATMYHLLSNTPPASAMERADAVINGQPDPLQPLHICNSQIPLRISAVLMQALALPTAERPSSALDMRAALQEARGLEVQPSATPPFGMLVVRANPNDTVSLAAQRVATEVTALNNLQTPIHQISTLPNQTPVAEPAAVEAPAVEARPDTEKRAPWIWVAIAAALLTMALALPTLGANLQPTPTPQAASPTASTTAVPSTTPSLPIATALLQVPIVPSPSETATITPTLTPSPRRFAPTRRPSEIAPTEIPSSTPEVHPTQEPSPSPTPVPPTATKKPEPEEPTETPIPTVVPSSTLLPTAFTTSTPFTSPTATAYPAPNTPTIPPTVTPDSTHTPTARPTIETVTPPTQEPTPTTQPTQESTQEPTQEPSPKPTTEPSAEPTIDPSTEPTAEPQRTNTRSSLPVEHRKNGKTA